MKTTITFLKAKIILFAALSITCFSVNNCSYNVVDPNENYYLEIQLKDIPAAKNEIQKYQAKINWQNRNLDGSYINMNVASALYARGLEGDYVKWNNVRTAEIKDTAKLTPEGKLLEFAEGFTYKAEGENIFKEEMYKTIPNNYKDLIKWFVWDAAALETYGLLYLDSLSLNVPFKPPYFNNNLVGQIENWGTIGLKSLIITWTGITKINEKYCAVIEYHSFFNPVNAVSNGMEIRSRSLYWGTIYVSLDKRQIEYGTINEDMPLELAIPGVPQKQLVDLQRQVEFTKVD